MAVHSIRREVTRLIVVVILVSVVLFSGVASVSLVRQSDVSNERLMSLICETHCEEMNRSLRSIEQSVDAVARYVDESLSVEELARGGVIGATGSGISLAGHDFGSERQARLDAYLAQHVADVESVFLSSSSQSEEALSFYYRINPELSRSVKGVLCAKGDGQDFVPIEPTDIGAYASNDYANVGWYYLPQESGCPTWIDPYYDANQGKEMISFIAPLYKAGTFIGVVGMDVSYDALVEELQGLGVLSSGYAFLSDRYGKIVYHPTLPRQMSLGDINDALLEAEQSEGSASLVTYRFEGIKKRAAWRTLANGMKLIICVPVSEINASWYGTLAIIVGSAVLIIGAVIAIVTVQTRRITEPLEELTVAAQQLSEGSFDVVLAYERDDEVGILTNSFRTLVDNLKEHIGELNDRAYRDALTQVRNKAAYDVYVSSLDGDLESGACKEFAVVAFDCNELKRINDSYGHDRGNVYLMQACHAICMVYDHSPVFRTGGDEFVAILTGSDYAQRDELLRLFVEGTAQMARMSSRDWEQVSLAVGMATYDPECDRSVEDVARRADERMYANKHAYKEAHKLS